MPPIGRRRPSAEVAAAVEMPATAAAPRLLAGPVGLLAGEWGGRHAGPPVPGHPAPSMLRRPGFIQAVAAPVAVQFRGGEAPGLALLGVGGDGAEFGQQPARRVQGQGALVDPPPPGVLPGHRPLLHPQLGVVGFHPAQVPLLGPPQDAHSFGGLVRLAARSA